MFLKIFSIWFLPINYIKFSEFSFSKKQGKKQVLSVYRLMHSGVFFFAGSIDVFVRLVSTLVRKIR